MRDSYQIEKLFIPSGLGLYNDEFSEFLNVASQKIESLTESQHSACIVFVQTGENTDLNAPLYDLLYHNATFDEVYEKMLKTHILLERIRKSNIQTIFSNSFNCSGSVFELLLSCKYALNFNESALFGFDGLEGDFFPPGGGYEKLFLENAGPTKLLERGESISAEEASRSGLLHFSINGDNHPDLTTQWIESNVDRLSTETRENRSFELVNADSFNFERHKINKLKIDVLTDYCFQNRSPRALSACRELISNRPKGLNHFETKSLTTYLSARYTLSTRFKGWFKSHLLTKKPTRFDYSNKAPVFSIFPYVPPVQPLLNTISRGQNLIFHSQNSTHLKNGIDLFVGRLEQQIGKDKSYEILNNQINWITGDESGLKGYSIKFEANSQFVVKNAKHQYRFFHSFSSKNESGQFIAEYPYLDNPIPDKIEKFLAIFCDQVICTKSLFSTQVPLISLSRSLLLQEVFELCRNTTHSLDQLLDLFKISGWRFCSSHSSWEKFLRSRQELIEMPEEELGKFPIHIDENIWRIGLWKEVRNQLKVKPVPTEKSFSTTFLSRHLMAFTCHLHNILSQMDSHISPEELDGILTESIGVPGNYGNIERYKYIWGEQRLEKYITHHWGRQK